MNSQLPSPQAASGAIPPRGTGAPLHRRRPWILTLCLLLVAVLFAYPFAWMLAGWFKSNRELMMPTRFWPSTLDWSAFRRLVGGEWFPFGRVWFNSLWVAFWQAAGAVALSSLAGYVFARHTFRGRHLLFMLSVTVIVIPAQAMAIPLFSWINGLGLTNHLAGVVLPGMVSGLGIIYFTQAFRHVPTSLVDAARVEGANEWRVYLSLLPLVRPAMVSFGLIHFILAWHQHLIPLLVLSEARQQTLPLALSSLYGSSLRYPYAALMVGSTFAVIPTAILFALLYRRLQTSLSRLLPH